MLLITSCSTPTERFQRSYTQLRAKGFSHEESMRIAQQEMQTEASVESSRAGRTRVIMNQSAPPVYRPYNPYLHQY